MTFRVLVVDDSLFFRKRISEILNAYSSLQVIDVAVNGQEAVSKVIALKPDVVTMDVEMPIMDGIEAVKKIMSTEPTPILMFSSVTKAGTEATLEALNAGALDFFTKNFDDVASQKEQAIKLLQERVVTLAKKKNLSLSSPYSSPFSKTQMTQVKQSKAVQDHSPLAPEPANKKPRSKLAASGKKYEILALAASTGGPVALQKILSAFPANFPYPILVIQHMPVAFTAAFAERLNNMCKIKVKEAENEDLLKAGTAYIARGGFQLTVKKIFQIVKINIYEEEKNINYKPCIDLSFDSIAKVYGGKVLAVVLTGMGVDGLEGGRALKAQGATIWAQDEFTSVVYGMPQAVLKHGVATESLAIDKIAERILIELGS